MASPATTETMEIRRRGRRRLVGVIAIVVILVVFLPMLLDTEQHRGGNEPSTQIPSKENAPPLPAPQKPASASPAPAPAASKPAPASPVSKPAPAPTVSRLAPAPAASKPAPEKAAPAVSVREAAPVAPQAAPRLEGFAVQVGAFKDEDTLKQARAKLALAGVAYYTERIGGGLTRLRAGPFASREAAEKARAALQQASLEGQVVPLP
jgi:DedD protein